METPFQYLKRNIDKINFDCDDKYKPMLKQAFSNVLERLDKFFIENKLYDCGDYQSYVEEMIKPDSKFSFKISEDIKQYGWAGVHERWSDGKRCIGINPEYLVSGTTLEGIICHEFFHQLTLGPQRLSYEIGDKHIEIEFGISGKGESREYVWEKGNTSDVANTDFREKSVEAMNGGFICEALTELTTQRVYSLEESYGAYEPQTKMLSFISKMLGLDINTREFLQGNLKTLSSSLVNQFDRLFAACNDFFKEFSQNHNIDYKNNDKYVKIQDLFIRSFITSLEDIHNNKYKPSDIARIIATIDSAPVPNRCYDNEIKGLKRSITRKQRLNGEDKAKFEQLLDITISEIKLQDNQLFTLPEGAPNIVFQRTEKGVEFKFNDSPFYSLNKLPKCTNHTVELLYEKGHDRHAISCQLTKNGFYKIEVKNLTTGEAKTIHLAIEAKNPRKILLSDKETGRVYPFSFDTQQHIRQKNIEENKNLLDNSQHINQIQNMINEMPATGYCDVRKIKSSNGQEYLIATSNNKTIFVKIVGNKYEPMVVTSETKLPSADIYDKIQVGTKETGMIGYKPTEYSKGKGCVAYTLSDGTTFVRYNLNSTKTAYAEQIVPFENIPDTKIVTTQNETLYSSSNKTLENIFERSAVSADSEPLDYETREIKREVPTENVNLEQTEQEKQKVLNEEMERRQQNIERRREEESRHENLSQEEIEKRNNKIEEERISRAQREQQQQETFNELHKNTASKHVIYDEFGVDITDIVNRQIHDQNDIKNGRGL